MMSATAGEYVVLACFLSTLGVLVAFWSVLTKAY